MTSAQVFIGYSHRDGEWLERLVRQLKVLEVERQISLWDDRKILAGEHWEQEIGGALDSADVAVLLISADFLTSNFIREKEVPVLMERRSKEGLWVLPVLIRPCDWEAVGWLDRLQVYLADEALSVNEQMVDSKLASLARQIRMRLSRRRSAPLPISSLRLPGSDFYQGIRAVTALPKLPPHFLDRAEDLAVLKERVLHWDSSRVGVTGAGAVGVQGMGGIGKTVLAAALAHDEEIRRELADGVFWVSVGRQPDLVLLHQELAGLLGSEGLVFESPQHGKHEVRRLLEGRRVLLVLDDVWELSHADMFDVVAPEGRLLITTRNREVLVGIGATEHQLDVLEVKKALQLLASWSDCPVSDLPEIAGAVAKECGYLPLALAMIGAMVRLSPNAWSDALRRLKESDLESFQRRFPNYPYANLLRALEVSVEDLNEGHRELYLELAVFKVGEVIPESAITTLWSASGLDGMEARDLIGRLVARSLIHRDEHQRLTLHDLQSDYIRSRVANLCSIHEKLVDAYGVLCRKVWSKGPDDGYFVHRLGWHLAEAKRFDLLSELLFDFAWLNQKLRLGGVNGLIWDYDLLLDSGERDEATKGDLKNVRGALGLAAHVLGEYPDQFAGQLLGRLRSEECGPGVEDLLRGARTKGTEGLVCRSPTLTPPGGPLLRILARREEAFTAVACIDRSRLLSASSGGDLQVWDLETGGLLRTLVGHSHPVNAVACLNIDRVASASSDGTLRIWDVGTGDTKQILSGHSGAARAITVLDEKRVVSASKDGTLRVWDLLNGVEISRFSGHQDWITSVEAWGSGKAVSGSWDRTLRVWDLENGAMLRILSGHRGPVRGLAILSRDRVVSASNDHTLRIWDLKSGALQHVLEGHIAEVRSVVKLDERRLLSASNDKTLRVWCADSGELLKTLSGHSDGVVGVALLDTTRALSASLDGTLRIWDTHKDLSSQKPPGHNEAILAVESVDQGRAVSAAKDGTLRVWSIEEGTTRQVLAGHGGAVNSILEVGGNRLISGSSDGTLRVWDAETGQTLHVLEGHSDAVISVTRISKCLALSSSLDKTLRIWDFDKGACCGVLVGHSAAISKALILNGKQAASASWDNTVKVWDLHGRNLIHTLEGHSGPVFDLVGLQDGRIVSASADGTIRVWGSATKASHLTLSGHKDPVSVLAVTEEDRVVSASWDGTIRVWDIEDGATLQSMASHPGAIKAMAVLDKTHVVTASLDATLRVWNLQTGRMSASFSLDAPVSELAVAKDGVIIAGDIAGGAHFLELAPLSSGLQSRAFEVPAGVDTKPNRGDSPIGVAR